MRMFYIWMVIMVISINVILYTAKPLMGAAIILFVISFDALRTIERENKK